MHVIVLQGLKFDDVCVDIGDKRILWSVSGHALHGCVLAIMGPSGEICINNIVSHNHVLIPSVAWGAMHVLGLSSSIPGYHIFICSVHLTCYGSEGCPTELYTLILYSLLTP